MKVNKNLRKDKKMSKKKRYILFKNITLIELIRCKQYNKTYRNLPKGMYRNSPISVQVLAMKCTSKPNMI